MQIEKYKLFKQFNCLILVVLPILIVGCSFAPIGENKFDCNRKDSPNEYCRSIKAVVRSTQGELPETRYEKEFDMHDYDRAYSLDAKYSKDSKSPQNFKVDQSVDPSRVARLPNNTFSLGYPMGQRPNLEGAPVRIAPVIQRVYIKSYVDADDVLIQDQIIYKEIAHSKWTGFQFGIDDETQTHGPSGRNAQPHRIQNPDPQISSIESPTQGKNPESNFSSNSNFSTNGSKLALGSYKVSNNLDPSTEEQSKHEGDSNE